MALLYDLALADLVARVNFVQGEKKRLLLDTAASLEEEVALLKAQQRVGGSEGGAGE